MVSPRIACCMVALIAEILVTRPGAAQPVLFAQPYSPRIANYQIDIRLDADAHLLQGRETLRWRNTADHAIDDLHFHLYLNAFRNDRSTFLRESGGRHRGNQLDEEGWGYIEIDSLTSPDGEDLLPFTEFIQPDDGNIDDKTVLRLQLPQPLPAGATITLHFAFTAKLPEPPMARTGIKEEFVMAGQWFPKIGVYENGAWNCHQFHANSEFYADFGVYHVNITVPESYIVGATGQCWKESVNPDSTRTHHYYAEDVHDFAWTASPDFVVFTGKSQDVEIRALIQKDHIGVGSKFVNTAATAIAWFQDNYGDYPYPNLTVVDPRRGAMGAGGMEYPTLITAWSAYGMPDGIRIRDMVIMHEFGHNYWYHLVASNEFEEAWLDEGINTFSEIQILSDTYGEAGSMIDLWGIKLSDLQSQRMSYIPDPDIDPIVLPSWKYYSGGIYSAMSYSKPGLVLVTLQNYLGRDTMNKIMRTYFERWKFKHPRTADFIAVANEVSGQELDWYFDQALHTTAVLDYGISKISSVKIGRGKGYDFDFEADSDSAAEVAVDSQKVIIEPASDSVLSQSDSSNAMETAISNGKEADDEGSKKDDALYESKVTVRRHGDFIFPVEVQFVFDDGDTVMQKWDGRANWKVFKISHPAKLLSATVDPDNKIPLDVHITNNSRTWTRQGHGMAKLTVRILFWVQFFLDMPQILHLLTAFSMNL